MLSARTVAGGLTVLILGVLLTADSPDELAQALIPLAELTMMVVGLYAGGQAGFFVHDQLGPFMGGNDDNVGASSRIFHGTYDLFMFVSLNIALSHIGHSLEAAELPISLTRMPGTFFAGFGLTRVTGRDDARRHLGHVVGDIRALFQPVPNDDIHDDIAPEAITPAPGNGPAVFGRY